MQNLPGNMPPHLLYLHRMGQARAHRRIAFQRKYLSLLLQAADGRRIDDSSTIALKLATDLVSAVQEQRLLRRAQGTLVTEFGRKIDADAHGESPTVEGVADTPDLHSLTDNFHHCCLAQQSGSELW